VVFLSALLSGCRCFTVVLSLLALCFVPLSMLWSFVFGVLGAVVALLGGFQGLVWQAGQAYSFFFGFLLSGARQGGGVLCVFVPATGFVVGSSRLYVLVILFSPA
jgi:hypothetical protein